MPASRPPHSPPHSLPHSPLLSVVIITLNAESQLAACLESAAFADEIVVVDSGSSDGTVALAERHGARVIRQDWLGYGPQKQFAVDAARHDWVLCLDADERLTPELALAITTALMAPQFAAYRFPRRNRFLGRYLRHGEGYPDWSLRLFDRRRGRWSEDAVHEKVLAEGPVGRLRGDLLHDSAETLAAYLAKQNRYTSLAAEAARASGKTAGYGKLFFSPMLRFVKFYILRQGFRDGLPGLVHIVIGCFNSFMKYAKILESQASSQAPR